MQQHEADNVRLTESRNTRSELVTNKERMAARRVLEWNGTLKTRLAFRYEISDLLSNHVEKFSMCYSSSTLQLIMETSCVMK